MTAELAYDHSQIARYVAGADSRHLSDALMREIYLRDNGTCQKCSRAVGPRAAHFDHIIPWSDDGGTIPWNLQVLCGPCNWAKGDRMDDQDYRKLAELDAFGWLLRTLKYIVTEYHAHGFTSLDATQKADMVRRLRDLADALERSVGEGS